MKKPKIIELWSHRKAARVELGDWPDKKHRFRWVIIEEDMLEPEKRELGKEITLPPAAAILLAEEIIKDAGGRVSW